jgi:hypothetical protein
MYALYQASWSFFRFYAKILRVKILRRQYWFIHFLRRLSLFLFVCTVILLTLFVIGNFQNFLDSSLLRLLALIESAALSGGVAIFFLLLVTLLFGILGRDLSIPVWISAAVGLFLLVVLLVLVKFLKAWL